MSLMPADRIRTQKGATIAIAALALLAVVGGLMLAGGPGRGRAERHDAIRVDDLQQLSGHVACLSTRDGRMPADLAETAACPGPIRLADPFTGAPYRIEPLEARKFRICAGFELPPDPAPRRWSGQGRDGDCMVFDLPRPDDPAQATEPPPVDQVENAPAAGP